ncbi:MAG: hypothetical protein RL494_42 [Bacteroidota bacterium]
MNHELYKLIRAICVIRGYNEFSFLTGRFLVNTKI